MKRLEQYDQEMLPFMKYLYCGWNSGGGFDFLSFFLWFDGLWNIMDSNVSILYFTQTRFAYN